MPRRPHLRTLAALAGLVLLAGCSSTPHVAAFHVPTAQQKACRILLDALPAKVAGEAKRESTGSRYAVVYGDPAIIIRCGVSRPKGSKVAPCISRNGIDWSVPLDQTDDLSLDVTMTLPFRTPRLQAFVPHQYRPAGPSEVMADLDAVIRARTKLQRRCTL